MEKVHWPLATGLAGRVGESRAPLAGAAEGSFFSPVLG
jgi:hypothetical protein